MTKKNIGILGSGQVGQVLGMGFLKHGYNVMIGTRDREKLSAWKTNAGPNAHVGGFEEAANFGEIIVLAVKGLAAEELVRKLGSRLSGKTVIDTTNPIAAAPPQNGVLKYFTDINYSLLEVLQQACPAANFVKAFNSVGNVRMVNPSFTEGTPTMFIAGNSNEAKADVISILEKFGWDVADMGKAEAGRAIEPLCMLWCIPGLTGNQWSHAFKLLRA